MYLIQTTVVVYHEVPSSPTTEVSSIPKSIGKMFIMMTVYYNYNVALRLYCEYFTFFYFLAVVSNVGVITISTVTVFIFIVIIIVLCVIIGIVTKIRRSRQNINGGISIVLTETDKMIVCMILHE